MLRDGFVGKCAYEISLPIPLHPRRVETVKQTLQRRMRNRTNQIDCRSLEFPDRLEYFLRLLNRPGVTPHDAAHLHSVKTLREWRGWRNRVESKKSVDVVGRLHDEVAVPARHLRRVFQSPKHRSAVHGVYRLPLEQKRRHDSAG